MLHIRLRKWVFILLNAEKDLSASELLTGKIQPISISTLRKYIGIGMRKITLHSGQTPASLVTSYEQLYLAGGGGGGGAGG